ncbi:nickel import ATP-binding protein NikE [Paenibacillus odorifer]|uniref:nickel import ATP-binding protein NikE n=1 Tax=Paenibacillus odorifer TaxID=189426 RepID=UPI002896727B|nr:nickel import ATP-binding protein NikE [Paenibacillus odorifer]
MCLLELKEVSHSYGRNLAFSKSASKTSVLTDISLTLKQGTCLGLLGSSGAGKSTLGKVILGLEQPRKGQVLFQGQDLYQMKATGHRDIRRNLQVVFQDCHSAVNPRMTAEQIIGEPLDNYERFTPSEQKRIIGEVLEKVGLKASDMLKLPHQFSGGQLQRINIARAIVLKPKLIVLDESVSSLDRINQAQIIQLFSQLKQSSGLSYVFITHDIKAAFALSDQLVVLDQGQIKGRFEPKERIFASSEQSVRALLGSALCDHPANRKIRPLEFNSVVSVTSN